MSAIDTGFRPLTMQDVRLRTGEGTLSPHDVLNAVNAELWSRVERKGVVPADVRRLVIAARKVAFDGPSQSELRELDLAAEAFAERVPWDDEPEIDR